jgi:hypothetical protein
MKRLIATFLMVFYCFGSMAQPNPSSGGGRGNGNGNGLDNNPCRNPRNPNCNPVPIEGVEILILAGALLGGGIIIRAKAKQKVVSDEA